MKVVKVKDWFVRNKSEIIANSLLVCIMLIIVLVIFISMLVPKTKQLMKEAETKDIAIQDLTQERDNYYNMLDSIQQSYSEVIPEQQYLKEVAFLESIISELMEECQGRCLKCETYNK